MATAEHELKLDYDEIMAALLRDEPTLATRAGSVLTKALVLAGASEIEVDFQRHLIEFYTELTGGSQHAASFVEKKAVKRQYHTYFAWDKKNANQFFGLFGPDFLAAMADKVRAEDDFEAAVRAFLELGNLRNEMVHDNFAAYALTKTADEVHELCEKARAFVDQLPTLLRGTYPPP